MSPLTITPTPTLMSRSFCLAIISLWWQYMGCLWCQKESKRGVEIRTGGFTTVQFLAHFPKCDNVDQFLTCPARASPPRRPTRWRTRGGPARLEGGGGEGSVWKSAKSNNFQGRKSAGKTSFFSRFGKKSSFCPFQFVCQCVQGGRWMFMVNELGIRGWRFGSLSKKLIRSGHFHSTQIIYL